METTIEHIGVCACGAVTVTIDGKGYSMSSETYRSRYGEVPEDVQKYGNCNHCVNHWGIDLCACGSGESPEECEEGYGECGNPMQNMDMDQTSVRARGALGL